MGNPHLLCVNTQKGTVENDMPGPILLPLDLTGTALDNRIENEEHLIDGIEENRIWVPSAGPFFVSTLQVRHPDTNALLLPTIDYQAIWLNADATKETGKTICSAVRVINTALDSVRLTYQAVGGDYGLNYDALVSALEAAVLPGASTIGWGFIVDKPAQFEPTAHIHHMRTIYGLEELLVSLESLRQAIIAGDSMAISAIYEYINNRIDELPNNETITDLYDGLLLTINNHISSGSAHTPSQVGLGNVPNHGYASTPQAVGGIFTGGLMNPFLTKAAFDSFIANWASATLKSGAYTEQSSDPELTQTTPPNTKWVSALQVKAAIAFYATATSVGLGNVQNYGVSTEAESLTGTTDIKHSTVLGVTRTIQGAFGSPANVLNNNPNTAILPIFFVEGNNNTGNVPVNGNYRWLFTNVFRAATQSTARSVNTERYQYAFVMSDSASAEAGGLWVRYRTDGGGGSWSAYRQVITKKAIGLDLIDNVAYASEAEAYESTADRHVKLARIPQVVYNVLRQVGAGVDPNTSIKPLFTVQDHANGPTNPGTFIVLNIFRITALDGAQTVNSTSKPRTQIAFSVPSSNDTYKDKSIYIRSHNGSTWENSGSWFKVGGTLPLANIDLDTLTEPGEFVQLTAANVTLGNNYPFNTVLCKIEVVYAPATLTVYQRYTSLENNSQTLSRSKVGAGTWSAWTVNQNLPTRLSTEDLNDLLMQGDYIQETSGNATLLKNYPVASLIGSINVFKYDTVNATSARVRQTFTSTATPPRVFVRHKYVSWDSWIELDEKATLQEVLTGSDSRKEISTVNRKAAAVYDLLSLNAEHRNVFGAYKANTTPGSITVPPMNGQFNNMSSYPLLMVHKQETNAYFPYITKHDRNGTLIEGTALTSPTHLYEQLDIKYVGVRANNDFANVLLTMKNLTDASSQIYQYAVNSITHAITYVNSQMSMPTNAANRHIFCTESCPIPGTNERTAVAFIADYNGTCLAMVVKQNPGSDHSNQSWGKPGNYSSAAIPNPSTDTVNYNLRVTDIGNNAHGIKQIIPISGGFIVLMTGAIRSVQFTYNGSNQVTGITDYLITPTEGTPLCIASSGVISYGASQTGQYLVAGFSGGVVRTYPINYNNLSGNNALVVGETFTTGSSYSVTSIGYVNGTIIANCSNGLGAAVTRDVYSIVWLPNSSANRIEWLKQDQHQWYPYLIDRGGSFLVGNNQLIHQMSDCYFILEGEQLLRGNIVKTPFGWHTTSNHL